MLLDENLPRQLAGELPSHEVRTVRADGWSGVLNGELLDRAEAAEFEVFVTADRNLEHQQSLSDRSLGVVVLITRRLKLEYLLPLMPAAREAVRGGRERYCMCADPPQRPSPLAPRGQAQVPTLEFGRR